MIVISAFSLSTGNLIDNFRGNERSFSDIFIVSKIRIEIILANLLADLLAEFFGVANQMLILAQDALRLQAS